jgi:GntR family transcriptional regulator/MocR family aminotransferase
MMVPLFREVLPLMIRRASAAALLALQLDERSAKPLFLQLYEALRGGALSGRLSAGMRLPATRALAGELGVSRNTVLNAYEQLLAEGYLVGRGGSGTFVAPDLPDELLEARARPVEATPAPGKTVLSRRGETMASVRRSVTSRDGQPRAFRPGVPAIDAFPRDIWMRLTRKHGRRLPWNLLDYGDPAGYRPLREAIATYVRAARAVRCDAEQVVIVSGAQQANDLCARLLLDPGDAAWVEDPGYLGARGALLAAGARIVPVRVDEEGLDVAYGIRREPRARLCCVTPSHQYPLGATLSLPRRLALLEWARQANARVIEDDYDSEFRYTGRPLASLQGQDCDGRVIYVGTFSKALFPSLRIGYIVAPPDLVGAFVNARALADGHSPLLTQAVLTDFLAEGHFARHIRRMRSIYAERQQALVRAAGRELGELLDVVPAATGLHLVAWLPRGVDDRAAASAAAAVGVEAPPVSAYRVRASRHGGLMLGYGGVQPRQIRDGVRALAAALAQVCK